MHSCALVFGGAGFAVRVEGLVGLSRVFQGPDVALWVPLVGTVLTTVGKKERKSRLIHEHHKVEAMTRTKTILPKPLTKPKGPRS